MLMKIGDFERLPRIDQYLREQRYEELDALVEAEAAHDLLGDQALANARALNLMPTVIFLATLGIENLQDPGGRAVWLEVYRTLGKKQETEGFHALPNRMPLKWAASSIISGKSPDLKALQKCKGDADAWQAAFELLVDQRKFDILEQLTTHLLEKKFSVEAWLQIVGMLVTRQSMLVDCKDIAPLARSQIRICKRLPDIHGLRATRSTLAFQAALYYQQADEHAKAIRAAELAVDPSYQIPKLVLHAESNCHLGNIAKSIEWLDRLLQMAGTPQFKVWQQKSLERAAANTHVKFDPALAAQALQALQHTLDKTGHKAFLVSGTLLGYARDGQLLAHDKDIDVGVFDWQSQFDIALVLLESPDFAVNFRTIVGAQTYHLPVKHLPTMTDIDVFLYHEEGGKLVTGVQSRFGYLQKFAFSPFELEEVEFLGVRTYVPADVDRNLTENFGNWRASDPGYISHLESPSTTDVGGLEYQLVGRLTSLEALRKGNPERLLRALDCMARESSRPGSMAPELIDLLREASRTLVDLKKARAA